jgi:hypothetical protein
MTRNGKPFFAGIALPPRLVGRQNEENHLYTVVSAWYDLTPTFYQQQWTVWDSTYVNEGGRRYGVRRLVGALPFAHPAPRSTLYALRFTLLPAPPFGADR